MTKQETTKPGPMALVIDDEPQVGMIFSKVLQAARNARCAIPQCAKVDALAAEFDDGLIVGRTINGSAQHLYERIDGRVDGMFKAGLVKEVQALQALPQPLSREARQALGYKEVLAHLEGQTTLEATIAEIKTRTRNFAKRQITWFRHLPDCRAATKELTEAFGKPTIR